MRRGVVIVVSIILIVGIVISAITSSSEGNGDALIFALMGMFLLGVMHLLSAIAGMIRGSKYQGIYLFVSVAYVFLFVAGVADYYVVPDFGIDSEYLGVIIALVLAVIYVLILIFEPEPEKGQSELKEELLDDDGW